MSKKCNLFHFYTNFHSDLFLTCLENVLAHCFSSNFAGLLQLKDPYTSNQSQKPYIPPFKSLLPQNLVPQKIQKNKIGPSVRSMKSFYADLETVYVGHVCLSWEILQWQYGKTRELLEFDSSNHHHYNQVANEFQLFQVLIQRFVENEPFQSGGPRIENYVNNRCVLRSLLQVPAVRGTCSLIIAIMDLNLVVNYDKNALFCLRFSK